MSPLTWPEFYLEPRHAMQIIGMDILLEGRGRAKSALILFKRLRVRQMGGTSKFFLNGSGFEKWEELVMDQKYETKLVLHLGTSTSRARM